MAYQRGKYTESNQLDNYDFLDVMEVAIKIFGHDYDMEAITETDELIDWIGQDQVKRIVIELNNLDRY